MEYGSKSKKLYFTSLAVCAAVFVALFMICIWYVGKESTPQLKYESSYEVDATIASESGINWMKIADSVETPGLGARVKIVYYNRDEPACTIIYKNDKGQPVAYASSVPLSSLTYFDSYKHESSNHTIYMRRGLSEAGFIALLVTVIITLVFLIYNVPVLIKTARSDGHFIKTFTVGSILNLGLVIASAFTILTIIAG